MSQESGTAAFLDTSIQIARVVHGGELKKRIKERIASYTLIVTSDVVKQEYKRRLLEEVQWCLNQLNDPKKPKTFEALFRYVTDVIPPQQERKKNICTQICHTVLSISGRGDLTERAKRHLRTLLKTGMALFENYVHHVVKDSGCACANHPIIEEKPYNRYNFGPNKCSSCQNRCDVDLFLDDHKAHLTAILTHINELPIARKVKSDGKFTEIGQIEQFLKSYVLDGIKPSGMNPCLTVGDLIIAMESRNIPNFYTMNGKESQFLCRWLGQTLIVRKRYYQHEDVICEAGG